MSDTRRAFLPAHAVSAARSLNAISIELFSCGLFDTTCVGPVRIFVPKEGIVNVGASPSRRMTTASPKLLELVPTSYQISQPQVVLYSESDVWYYSCALVGTRVCGHKS